MVYKSFPRLRFGSEGQSGLQMSKKGVWGHVWVCFLCGYLIFFHHMGAWQQECFSRLGGTLRWLLGSPVLPESQWRKGCAMVHINWTGLCLAAFRESSNSFKLANQIWRPVFLSRTICHWVRTGLNGLNPPSRKYSAYCKCILSYQNVP